MQPLPGATTFILCSYVYAMVLCHYHS
jgi:hypothetical protein